MNTKKLFFSDMDGTLLTDDKKITPKTKKALEEFLEEGNYFCICTGRPTRSALVIKEILNIDSTNVFTVAFNGAQILDNSGNGIYKSTLDLEDVQPLYDLMTEHGIFCQTYDDESIIITHHTQVSKLYQNNSMIPARIVSDFKSGVSEPPCKILGIDGENKGNLSEIKSIINKKYSHKYHSFQSSDTYLEVVSKEVTKGNAVQQLSSFLDIPLSNIMCAGDAENDIPMLSIEGIGLSVAMQNAYDFVKKSARLVTEKDNNHDGLAEYIEMFRKM